MDGRLLRLLACPYCQGKLLYDQQDQTLVCLYDKSSYLIIDQVPVMLIGKVARLQAREG